MASDENKFSENDLFSFADNQTGKEKVKDFLSQNPKVTYQIQMEWMIAFVIFVALLCFILFILGFKSGYQKSQDEVMRRINNFKQKSSNIDISNKVVPVERAVDSRTTTQKPLSPEQKLKSVDDAKPKMYTIQAVTYRNSDQAEKEMRTLNQKGYSETKLITSGVYTIVCVGEYVDRAEAKNDLIALKGRYKDAFLRKL